MVDNVHLFFPFYKTHNFGSTIPLTFGAVVGLTADQTRGRRAKTEASLIKIWIWEMFFCFGSRCLHFIGFCFTKRDSFSALRTIDLHCRRPDSPADWGLKRLPKKQRFSSRPTLICPIAARRRSNIPSARQTNTATSIRLWLRLNTPANLPDTATYSTPRSPLLQTHPPPRLQPRLPLQNQPGGCYSLTVTSDEWNISHSGF